MKQKARKMLIQMLPAGIANYLKLLRDYIIEFQLNRYDSRRFRKYHMKQLANANLSQIEGKLTLHAHAIEKGLSHDQVRLGFGKKALAGFADTLKVYELKGYDKGGDTFLNSLSTLREYIDFHESHGYDISYLDEPFGHFIDDARTCEDRSGGAMVIEGKTKSHNKTVNFATLFNQRYSVRTYADTPVDMDAVRSAIDLSRKAPSVCNRQSGRVCVLTKKKMVEAVLKQQGGLQGYPTPPMLLVITTDSGSFLTPDERNQIYIDGGLLSMALLLSLEYEGLAACPLNAELSIKREKIIRNTARIPDSENIIMFVAVGNFKDKNNVPKSFRLKQQDITREL